MKSAFNSNNVFSAKVNEYIRMDNGQFKMNSYSAALYKEDGQYTDVFFPERSLKSTPDRKVEITSLIPLFKTSATYKVVSMRQISKKYDQMLKKIGR